MIQLESKNDTIKYNYFLLILAIYLFYCIKLLF